MVSQLEAVRAAVKTLDLGSEYGPLIAYCEGLAEQVDLHPDSAALWREYRPAIELLIAAGEVDETEDGEAQLLTLMRTAVGYAKTGPRKPGSGGRGRSGPVGPAVDAVAATGS